MFGARPTPEKAYRNVGFETSIPEASPHQLIVLLFEGAREAIVIARSGMESKNIPQKGTAITKAIDIILNGLRACINLEEGGDLAQNLYALYDYMARRLLHANMHNDQAALDEVLKLLAEIHSAWIVIGNKTDQSNAKNPELTP